MAITEEPYDLILVVKVAGYGTLAHARKEAATLKRVLEVNLHNKPEVLMVEPDGETVLTLTCTEVTWGPLHGEAGP